MEGLPVTDEDSWQEGKARLHHEHQHDRPQPREVEHVLRLEHRLVKSKISEEVLAVKTPPRLLLDGVPTEE